MYDYSTYQHSTIKPGWAEERLSKTKELPIVFYLSQELIRQIHDKVPTPQSLWAERVLKDALNPRQAKKEKVIPKPKPYSVRALAKDLKTTKTSLLVWLRLFGWNQTTDLGMRLLTDEQIEKLLLYKEAPKTSGLQYLRRIAETYELKLQDVLQAAKDKGMNIQYVAGLKELPAVSFPNAYRLRRDLRDAFLLRLNGAK